MRDYEATEIEFEAPFRWPLKEHLFEFKVLLLRESFTETENDVDSNETDVDYSFHLQYVCWLGDPQLEPAWPVDKTLAMVAFGMRDRFYLEYFFKHSLTSRHVFDMTTNYHHFCLRGIGKAFLRHCLRYLLKEKVVKLNTKCYLTAMDMKVEQEHDDGTDGTDCNALQKLQSYYERELHCKVVKNSRRRPSSVRMQSNVRDMLAL